MNEYFQTKKGDMITLTSVTLPVASYSKFKPQQVDFLNITNPKAVLEKHLRSFACLSKNDMISIDYLGKEYELQIVETKESYLESHPIRIVPTAVCPDDRSGLLIISKAK